MAEARLIGVAPAAINFAFCSYTAVANTGMNRPWNTEQGLADSFVETWKFTYTSRLARHVEGAAFEVAKVFEEYGDKGGDVYCSFVRVALLAQLAARSRITIRIRTHHIFSVVSVREAHADWLVDEKDVRLLVPRIWVECNVMDVIDAAGACIVVSWTPKPDS